MTGRANSAYAGHKGNRAGVRYMRLTLFDRIRRLARSRKPAAGTAPGASGTQGRHRRGRRRGPSVPPPPPPPRRRRLVRWASPGPEISRRHGYGARRPRPAGASPPAGGSPRPGPTAAGSPAVRAGAARARIREAPADAAPVGVGEAARPVPVAADHRARWQETAQPGQAQAAAARSAGLARVAAGIPRQPDGLGQSSWRPAMAVAHAGLPLRLRASAGTAAGRGRPAQLRLPRGHPVAAVGSGFAAAP